MSMANPKEIPIKSLSDFTQKIEGLLGAAGPGGNWYRGIGRGNTYKLEPSLYRHASRKIEELLRIESRMLQDFTGSIMINQGASDDNDKSTLKTLFYMQHYGVPTRLLDWSTNPFIALYFALTGADSSKEDAAVWVIDPAAWNEKVMEHVSWGKSGPLNYTDVADNYGPYKLLKDTHDPSQLKSLLGGAACVLGIASNARMFAQRGVFSMFGRSLTPMEEQFAAEKYPPKSLTKIVIPKGLVNDLLSLLLKIGYTDSVSYPDVSGLAMEIKRTYGFKV
jgi:hypothetical protein